MAEKEATRDGRFSFSAKRAWGLRRNECVRDARAIGVTIERAVPVR
jgi:hypothetical protein